MIKGIFITEEINEEKVRKIEQLGFNSVFTNYQNFNHQAIKLLREKNFKIFSEIGIFPIGGGLTSIPSPQISFLFCHGNQMC